MRQSILACSHQSYSEMTMAATRHLLTHHVTSLQCHYSICAIMQHRDVSSQQATRLSRSWLCVLVHRTFKWTHRCDLVSNEELFQKTGERSIPRTIAQWCVRWLGYVLRLPPESPTVSQVCDVGICRSQSRWKDVVRQNCHQINLALQDVPTQRFHGIRFSSNSSISHPDTDACRGVYRNYLGILSGYKTSISEL